MFENIGAYHFAKRFLSQPMRNRLRASVRLGVDIYAGCRGLNPASPVPEFLIIGAQKAGTTSLFNWLVESDVAQSPLVKEVGFFDSRWHRPIKYRGYFNSKESDALIGEATPSYLAFPEVPERVMETLGPSVKIVVILRDPVDRAVSHYFHERRLGFEHRDMYAAMVEEEGLVQQALDPNTATSRRQYILRHYSYIYRSRYSERLAPWIATFGGNNLLILNSEAMFANPQKAIVNVAKFLQIDEAKISKLHEKTEYKPKNKNSYVFEDERVSKFLESRLCMERHRFKNWDY